MKCAQCGYIIPDDSDFCQFCGSRVTPSSQEEPAVIGNQDAAKALTASQRYFDSDYGYSPENPIVTSSIPMIGQYLYALRTSDGKAFTWERQPHNHGGAIDEYLLFVDGVPYKTIYFNPHGEDRDFLPVGLTRNEDALSAIQQGLTLEEYQSKIATLERENQEKQASLSHGLRFSAVLLILSLLGWLIWTFGAPGVRYLRARQWLENGDYDQAYAAFLQLGSFGDSKIMCKEAQYRKARALVDAKSFDQANIILESLGTYKDSKSLIHVHSYLLTIETEATCTTNGSTRKTCSCGESHLVLVSALGHTSTVVSTTPGSCTTPSQRVLQCARCGLETTEIVAPAGHRYVENIAKEATCSTTGTKKFTCSDCGDTYSETMPKVSHNYKPATCTAPKTCTYCGKTDGAALGHTDSETKCARCGVSLFKTLTYSGTGSKVIKNISLPKGKFFLSGRATSTNGGYGSFHVYLDYYTAYWVESLSSSKQYIEKSVPFSGPLSSAILEIDAADNVRWTISIELAE